MIGESISISTALWFLGGAVTVIGGLLAYIFSTQQQDLSELKRGMTRIEEKIDTNEAKNAEDHARVDARLAALEERTRLLLRRDL